MKDLLLVSILFLCMCFTACTHRNTPEDKLVQADSLMQTLPDSALRILRSMHPQKLQTPADRAYYALLLTQANDKNYVIQTDDSLIRSAVQYYDATKDVAMQARAHYLLGSVYRDANKSAAAIKEYLTAIPLAEKAKASWLLAAIYSNAGYIYYMQNLNERADSIYQLTEQLAIRTKDSISLAECLSRRGMIELEKGEKHYSKAEIQLLQAYKIATLLTRNQLKLNTTLFLSTLYSRMNNGEKALDFAKQHFALQTDTATCYYAYSLLGEAYYKVSRYDSATIYLNRSLHAKGFSTKAGAYMRLADIAKEQGDFEQSMEMERMYSAYMDSIKQSQQTSTILVAESNLKIVHQQAKYNGFIKQYRYYLISLVIVGTLFFLYSRKRFQQRASRLQQDKLALKQKNASLQNKLKTNEERMQSLQMEIEQDSSNKEKKQNLQNELYLLENERATLLKDTYEYSAVHIKMKQIITDYKQLDKSTKQLDANDWKQLIAEADKRWNNVTLQLKTEYNLSQEEVSLCCLYLIGLPKDHIKYLLNCSRDTVYKKSYAILDKMKQPRNIEKLKEVLDKYTNNTLNP